MGNPCICLTTSASDGFQSEARNKKTPLFILMWEAAHKRSFCTAQLTHICALGKSFPAIFGYRLLRDGRSKGYTLKLQFNHPAKRCHSRRVCLAPRELGRRAQNSSILWMRSFQAVWGSVKVMALGSTLIPMMVSGLPNNCFFCLNGTPSSCHSSSNLTWSRGMYWSKG